MDKKKKPIDVSKYQKGGSVNPIYVTDPNDPRLQAYQDSLQLYNRGIDDYNWYKKKTKEFPNGIPTDGRKVFVNEHLSPVRSWANIDNGVNNNIKPTEEYWTRMVTPAKTFLGFETSPETKQVSAEYIYKKPIQPVELKNNITGDHAFTNEGDNAYIGNRWVGKFEQTPKNTNGEPAFKKMISKMPPKRKEINVAPIEPIAPTTSVGTPPSRQVQEPNVQEHNVLGDQVFIPVTKSGSYHDGEPVGSDRIIRYESVDGTKSYTKKEYEKLKKGQVKTHKKGGLVKHYQSGGEIDYQKVIDLYKWHYGDGNNIPPPIEEISPEQPFIDASPFMGALLEGSLNEKNAKRPDIFNPIQGFHGYNYQLGGDVNVNTSGYTPGYPSFDNPENTIPLGPSKTITMENTPFPVLAIPDVGEPVILKPGQTKVFKNATKVREIPMKNNKFQLGGTSPANNPQGQPSSNPFENIPNKFNNQTEDQFVLGSYLPYILDDSRNTLNAGKRSLAPIQTEDGELITSPLGDIVDVAANKAHKNMESDKITDFSAEGNYILSDDKHMIIKKGKDGGVVNGIKLKDVLIGMDAMYYKEGELIKTPKEYTLEDIAPKKSKYTFAELGKNVQKHFPLSTEENDIFAKRAQVENKLSRIPYTNSIIELSEIKKQSMNKNNSTSKFKQGGYASMAKIYNPALKSLGNSLADGSTNGFYFEPDPQLNPKRDNNFKTPSYQDGGYSYDHKNRNMNKREQWNYWVEQTQRHFNDYAEDSQRNNQAMLGVNALGILGQNAYQGDNDFLYGNAYNSKMDNLSNKVDRSFAAEQSYNENLVNRENSAYRLGMNTGATPNDFAPSRANAIREQGAQVNNTNKERRSFTDRYGVMDANATDMFAGRRNQQKAYLNDFSNNQVQNLAGAGTGYLQNKIGIQGANLQAQSSLQLMKQAGNGWTDFANGLGDVMNVVTGLVAAVGGLWSMKGTSATGPSDQGGPNSPQGRLNGLNPNNWGAPTFNYNSQLYNAGNPYAGYQGGPMGGGNQPYQPSWNNNRGWGPDPD